MEELLEYLRAATERFIAERHAKAPTAANMMATVALMDLCRVLTKAQYEMVKDGIIDNTPEGEDYIPDIF